MKRRGKSLVEMLVVITLLGGLAGTSGTVIHRLMRAEQAVHADLVWQRSVNDLAEQFRADVHAATEAALIDEGNGLRLTLPDGTVTYAISRHGIGRIGEANGKDARSQEYRLEESGVKFTTEAAVERTWATVSIPRTQAALTRSAIADTVMPRVEIRAVLGRRNAPAGKDGVS